MTASAPFLFAKQIYLLLVVMSSCNCVMMILDGREVREIFNSQTVVSFANEKAAG